jgi:hypothetical protein
MQRVIEITIRKNNNKYPIAIRYVQSSSQIGSINQCQTCGKDYTFPLITESGNSITYSFSTTLKEGLTTEYFAVTIEEDLEVDRVLEAHLFNTTGNWKHLYTVILDRFVAKYNLVNRGYHCKP